MAHFSRRSRRRKAEANQKLISFTVRGEQFAVPVGLVEKVISVDCIYGGLEANSPGLAMYSDRQISVLNLDQHLFTSALPLLRDGSSVSSGPSSGVSEPSPRYLLVIPSPADELVGLLVETPPALIRVPTSAFSPVPQTYRHAGHIRCVGAIITLKDSPIFLINVGELLQPPSLGVHRSPDGDSSSSREATDPAALAASLDPAALRLLASPPES